MRIGLRVRPLVGWNHLCLLQRCVVLSGNGKMRMNNNRVLNSDVIQCGSDIHVLSTLCGRRASCPQPVSANWAAVESVCGGNSALTSRSNATHLTAQL